MSSIIKGTLITFSLIALTIIDLPREDKQKGPSKENRHDPIIGQALLLDADLVPLAMQMYPGNESEKPYIRKMVEEMKKQRTVTFFPNPSMGKI